MNILTCLQHPYQNYRWWTGQILACRASIRTVWRLYDPSTTFVRPLVDLLLSKLRKISILYLFWPISKLSIHGKISQISLKILDLRWSRNDLATPLELSLKSRNGTRVFSSIFLIYRRPKLWNYHGVVQYNSGYHADKANEDHQTGTECQCGDYQKLLLAVKESNLTCFFENIS